MRIVTRPDFDGVVCAVLLMDAEKISKETLWVEPNDMQKGIVDVLKGDIVANLPYHHNSSLWFDHHFTNKDNIDFKGLFRIAPSAAGLVYEYYDKHKFKRDYNELIIQTDKIDSADLTEDEVNYPEKYPYILLSMTISGRDKNDEIYWNKIVDLLRRKDIHEILKDTEVNQRCENVVKQNEEYRKLLKKYTKLQNHVAVTDFRTIEKSPQGNRFLVYSMYREANVQVKISRHPREKNKIIVSVGHSIINNTSNVNIGLMLSEYQGGGHRGAGSCSFSESMASTYIPQILSTLEKNISNE
jgi:oligoribonuclease NrnB/cAMP/cGMP phosphodiesterase (DHH superfamily)